MVIQMLAASGHARLSDGQRGADASTPRGYLELLPCGFTCPPIAPTESSSGSTP
jgi:hypothetical protein